jgi:hypothetical protein
MSVERIYRWTCDACKGEELAYSPGLPDGWGFMKGKEGHYHLRCIEIMADASRPVAGSREDRWNAN